ncbi:MAG: SMP-30/gluconolactonase/LRE family protein [Propionibacteriaceae bacterium]|jgi:sugar lactone lactonase YvrE|nr:SMP-30/gluconolactonase/LRE family protein [Propionibacteriaceae bacterium]
MRAEIVFDGFYTDPVLDHPECVAFDPVDHSLWCGGEAGQIYRLDLDAGTIELKDANPGGFTLGVAFGPERTLYWLDAKRRQVRRLAVGAGTPAEVVVDGKVGGHRLAYPNAIVFADNGVGYFTDSQGGGPGVYRLPPGGSAQLWSAGPFNFANGIAYAPDGTHLLVAESNGAAIARVPILEDGSAGPVSRPWSVGGFVPDGVTFGPDGRAYVACYYPSAILRLEDDGSASIIYEDPQGSILSNPANLTFYGTDAYVANLGRWHITRLDFAEVLAG